MEKVAQLQANVFDLVQTSRRQYYLYVGLSLYIAITALSTPDAMLALGGQRSITLPLFTIQMPVRIFYLLSPVLLLAVFVYFQLHFLSLCEETRRLIRYRQNNTIGGPVIRRIINKRVRNSSIWIILFADFNDRRATDLLLEVVKWLSLWAPLLVVMCILFHDVMKLHTMVEPLLLLVQLLSGLYLVIYFIARWRPGGCIAKLITTKIKKKAKTLSRRLVLSLLPFVTICLAFWLFILPPLAEGEFPIWNYNLADAIVSRPPVGDTSGFWSDLSRTNLRGASFQNAFLFRANFEGAVLKNADFTGSNLRWSNFEGAALDLVDLSHAILEGVKFDSTRVLNSRIASSNLTRSRFNFAQILNSELINVDFSLSDIRNTKVDESRLVRIKFMQAFFFRVIFRATEFDNCTFLSSNLGQVDFQESVIQSTTFVESNLVSADFRGTTFDSVIFFLCDIRNVNFRNSNFRKITFESTLYNELTEFPANFDSSDRRHSLTSDLDEFMELTGGKGVVGMRNNSGPGVMLPMLGVDLDKAEKRKISK